MSTANNIQSPPKRKPVSRVSSIRRLWFNSFMVQLFTAILFCAYYVFLGDELNIRTINKTLASSGTVVIGMSYGLTAMAYYFDFLDSKVGYRKYLGLIGFYTIIVHFALSLYLIPLEIFFKDNNLNSFLFGLSSLLILIVMALISNKTALKELGGKNWKRILRLGYVSYFLALAHYFVRGIDDWREWLSADFFSAPPPSLLVAIFSVYVLVTRTMLSLSLLLKKLLKSE